MDTTSGALSRLLFVLAEHPEAQCKLRAAIAEARQAKGGDLNFDDLASIPFLDAVCRETMRLCVTVIFGFQADVPSADILL
jgi:cytochrome P450